MMYKSFFFMAILGLTGVEARIFEKPEAAEAVEAIEQSVPAVVEKLEGMIEQGQLQVDPAFEFDVPQCNCTCTNDLTGTAGVIVTPTGPGLINLCVPETYIKIFIYFPDLFQTLFPQIPAIDFVCASSDEKKGCPTKLVIPLPLPELPGKNKTSSIIPEK